MTAGAHPFTAELGVLTDDPRYVRTLDEYGERARRQLVAGLHLHVSLGGADRTLAVYNALRSHLPELAALAANAPFHAGRDTGLASIRPTIAVYLQRQGVPPHIPSWEWFADALQLGRALRHGARRAQAGGSSCACTRPTGRSSCACPTRSRASTTCTAWPRSPTG